MRILFIGDVVGRSGRTVVNERLPGLVRDWKLDFVVINGENAAGGFGITEAIYQELLDAGADAITLGNHAWDQKEALVFIERAPKLVRPLNYPDGTPGRGTALIEARNGGRVLVVTSLADTGPGTLRWACEQGGARIIVFTGHDNEDMRQRAMDAGANDWVLKGGDLNNLLDALSDAAKPQPAP